MINILFFGSSANSTVVKNALIKAGYTVTIYKSINDRKRIYIDDLIISADYGKKLPPGGLNLHPSLLPKYRGPTPVPQQIFNNETESGITIIKMTDEFDAGPIIAQEKVPILPNDTAPVLLTRCFTAGAKLLVKILPDYLNNKITQKKQDEALATYTRKFTKADGFIPWEEFVKSLKIENCKLRIERAARALYPWPGVWTKMPASTRVRSSTRGRPNNKSLKLLPKNLVQLEGKSPITLKQFLAGYQHLLK